MDGNLEDSGTSESDSESHLRGTRNLGGRETFPHSTSATAYYQPFYPYFPQTQQQQTPFQRVGQLDAGLYPQMEPMLTGTGHGNTSNVLMHTSANEQQQFFRPYIMDPQYFNQVQQNPLGGSYQGFQGHYDPHYYNAMQLHGGGGPGMQQNPNLRRQFEPDYHRVSNLQAENMGVTRSTTVPQSSQAQGPELRRRKNLSLAERHLLSVKRRKRNRHVSRKLYDEQLNLTIDSNSTSILEAGVDANVEGISWSDLHLSKETQEALLSLLPVEKQGHCLELHNATELSAIFMPLFSKDDLTENQKKGLAQFRSKLRTAKKSQREKVKRLQINGMLNKIGPHIGINTAKTDLFTILSASYEKLLELAEYKVNCTCSSIWKRMEY